MPDFRRYYIPNAVIFITSVTRNRKPYLQSEEEIAVFWDTLRHVQTIHPFNLLAYVVLPDHFHWLMRVDDRKENFSGVLHSIKRNYSLNYKKIHRITAPFTVWQSRFWDHIIRNESDLEKHFDYIHWNPVKHGYVDFPEEWPHSSHLHWLKLGYYLEDFGQEGEPMSIKGMNIE